MSLRNRRGVLLLIVLVALIVVSSALVQVAATTSRLQRQRVASAASMQRRWAVLSCERAVLPAARSILAGNDSQIAVADTIVVGGQALRLIVADEDAKVNLNAIHDGDGPDEIESAIRDLIPLGDVPAIKTRPRRRSQADATAADARVAPSRLNPNMNDDFDDDFDDAAIDLEMPPALVTWGDVFDYPTLMRTSGDLRQLAVLSQNITLWGSGRLNVWRAQDDSIVAVCRGVVQDGLARRIVSRLRESSLREIDLVLQQTVTNANDRRLLSERLADASDAYSVWIEAGDANQRVQQFTVTARKRNGRAESTTFSFP